MEPNRSCCSRETCCGMLVETGAYIFAIINAIVMSAGVLGALVFLGMMLRMHVDPEQRGGDATLLLLLTVISVLCLVGAGIVETLAVLLCVGISKRKPQYMKPYIVFGIFIEILCLVGTGFLVWFAWGETDRIIYPIIMLGICVVYALLLLMLRQTYIVFSEPLHAGHRQLKNRQFDF